MSKLDKQYIALAKKMERMEKMGQRALANNYKNLLEDLRKKMAKMYESYEINGQLTFDEMARYNRLDKLDKDVQVMVNTLYRANGKIIRGTLAGVASDTYKGSIGIVNGYANQKVKGIMKPFDVTATVNREMAGLKWTHRIGKQRDDLIYDIQKEIKLGLTQGDTYGDMANRLKLTINNDKDKADVIIRTEAHRCKGESRQQSFNDIAKAGIKFKKKWVSVKNESVRNAHKDLNGTILNEDEDFVSPNGGVGYGPGQMNNADDDINCRCILTLVLDTEDSKGLLDNSEDSGYNDGKEVSGALNPNSRKAQEHSGVYYESVRKMKTDCEGIARNTGYKAQNILKVKEHIFTKKHDLGGNKPERFYPDYEMSQSWQRLIEGKDIQSHDYTLLKHEFIELKSMEKGFTQEQAHEMANKRFNYAKELEER